MKCVVYRRVSSVLQTKGHGLDRQLELAENIASSEGLTIVRRYTDEGASGYKGAHLAVGGQLKALYDDIQSGVIKAGTVILVEDLDRLSRQEPTKALSELLAVLNADIQVWTFLDGLVKYSKSEPMMLMMALAKAQMAHDESKKKQERSKANWAKKIQDLKDGKKPALRVPFWIDSDGESYTLNGKAKLVRKIFDMSLKQGMGRVNIAKKLNADKEPVVGWRQDKRTNGWDSNKVSFILRSVGCMGDWQSNDKQTYIKGVFPAVVSKDEWNKVQILATKNPRVQSKHKVNILQGLLKCPYCSGVLSRRGSKPKGKLYYSYRCTNSMMCPASVQVSEKLLHDRLMTYLQDLEWDKFEKEDSSLELQKELQELQQEEIALEASVKVKVTALKLQLLDECQEKIQEIQQQLQMVKIVPTKKDFILTDDNLLQVQQTLKILVKHITVYGVGVLQNELVETLGSDKFQQMKKWGKANTAHLLIEFSNGELRQVGLSQNYVSSNRDLKVRAN